MNVSGTPSRYSASLMALATTGPATLETMMQSTLTPAGKWLNASAEPACAVANAARPRGIPVIAFSTDASVAARGVYLLSFLPESDVNRIVQYAASTGKRSFAALLPDNAYGNVVEGAFKQAVGRD